MKLFSFDGYMVLDGSTGYNLQKAGMPAGVCPEKWIIDNPTALINLQRRYMAAGSDAVYAPTFGANRVKLKKYGLEDRTAEINAELVKLSRNAVCSNALVAGDLSPVGLFVQPYGDSDFETLYRIYREQALALERAGVDFFVIETMMTLAEARAALMAVKDVSEKPAAVSFTFEKNGRTLNGTEPLAALTVMQSLGADAFGINCSNGPDEILELIKQLSPYTCVPLLSKPNAGLPCVDGCGSAHYDMTPQEFCRSLQAFSDAGVRLFGGCCGTGPEHIQALTEGLSQLERKPFEPQEKCVLASTERRAFNPVEPSADECAAEDLLDAAAEADMDGMVWVRVDTEEDAEEVVLNQGMAGCAIGIRSSSPEAAESLIRAYNGRLLYRKDDLGDMPAQKYGAIPV